MKNVLLVVMAFIAIAAVGTVIALSSPNQVRTQSESTAAIEGGFASITTEQTGDKIIITIVREPGSTPTDGNVTLPEVPEGPIIIVPDPGGEGNGTVIVPQPPGNETSAPGNETTPTEPPVVIIEPPGNVTQVEPPSNVTVIDNGTVIIHPPAQNVTETPGNVTVVDPPSTGTEPCGCPSAPEEPTLPMNETSEQPVQPADEPPTDLSAPAPNQDLPN
jgi:hypothetical protein